MIPAKIGFIGLGHIGGSVAKTIHRIYPGIQLIAFDTSQETLRQAKEEQLIVQGYSEISEDFASCDYIYLCAPVLCNSDYLPAMKELTAKNPNLLLTDVGSVKHGIHEKVIEYGLEEHFIGGHPMCGTEHTGFSHSTAYMLENAYYIITPTAKTPAKKVREFQTFVDSLDALSMVLDYKEHDFMVGSVSHLPHVISATLVNLVKRLDNQNGTMRSIAAGGFKDITRISSSSPLMWENICQANRQQILELIDTYVASIGAIRETIAGGDGKDIYAFFESAKDYRDSFSVSVSGPISQSFHIFCDLRDEAGSLATVTTILSSNSINIKNVGITHNREYEQGVLSIEFYSNTARIQAIELLRKYHYTIYE